MPALTGRRTLFTAAIVIGIVIGVGILIGWLASR